MQGIFFSTVNIKVKFRLYGTIIFSKIIRRQQYASARALRCFMPKPACYYYHY